MFTAVINFYSCQPLSYLATGMRADGGTDVKLFHDRSRYTSILFPLTVKLW